MANVEQISQVDMQVITYAGLAKSSYLEALKYYRENDQTAYEQSMSNGSPSSIVTAGNEYAGTTNHNVDGACGRSAYVSRNNKDFDSRNNFIDRK